MVGKMGGTYLSSDNKGMSEKRWQDVLFSQGFGTRRVCLGLIQQGLVAHQGIWVTDHAEWIETDNLHFTVQGETWPYHEQAYLMLHKPAGTECSQKASLYPSIYTL